MMARRDVERDADDANTTNKQAEKIRDTNTTVYCDGAMSLTERETPSTDFDAENGGWEEAGVQFASTDAAFADAPLDHTDKPLSDRDLFERNTRLWCCPFGVTKHSIPLFLGLIALACTGFGAWDCSYFVGATTGFTGNRYGLWTLENIDGTCQLWDVIYFSYSLGGYLIAARGLSMTAMVLGLSLLTAMSQALECHIVNWGVGFTLFVLFIVSVSTTSQFNLWTIFFLFLYVILVLIVRSLFIHPVHRVISSRGSKLIAWLLILCFVLSIMTLLVLKSWFCQCDKLTSDKLENRDAQGQDICQVQCELGPAGIVMVIGSCMWLLSGLAVFKVGVQPEGFQGDHKGDKYQGYSKASITTRAKNATKSLVELGHSLHLNMSGAYGDKSDDDQDADLHSNDDDEFHRTCRQKLCCDYRATPRSRIKRVGFCCFRSGLAALVGIFLFIVVILIGSRKEKMNAEQAPSTSPNFITKVTCAFNASDIEAPFVTYDSPEEAEADNMTIAHCGACASCSNMEDITTYITTRETITVQAKSCGKKAVFGTGEALDDCLEETIGFTDDCRTCWVENMKCDARRCIFTCMKTFFTGFLARNTVPQSGSTGRLNWCLQCDEKVRYLHLTWTICTVQQSPSHFMSTHLSNRDVVPPL